ncbi:Ig domain-containing protein, partial [Vibrio fluvialis]|nr:Ig domain-containing protein [Vibrio fluvialis]
IDVSPAGTKTIVEGLTLKAYAHADFTDGSHRSVTHSVSWVSSDTSVATVDALGNIQAVKEGTTIISASQDGVTSNTLTINVLKLKMLNFTITPKGPHTVNENGNVKLYAWGDFNDGNAYSVTHLVSWTSSDTSVATVDAIGNVHAVKGGTAVISGSLDGITANKVTINVPGRLVSINVGVDNTIVRGSVIRLSANGNYSDGTTRSINNEVQWSSLYTSVATVDGGGYVHASTLKSGWTEISASLDGIKGNKVTITVVLGVNNFMEPLTVTQADAAGYSNRGSWGGSAVYDYEQAFDMCSAQGYRLPTAAELRELYSVQGNMSNYGWKVERAYWTSEEPQNNYRYSYGLNTGKGAWTLPIIRDGGEYATCIKI